MEPGPPKTSGRRRWTLLCLRRKNCLVRRPFLFVCLCPLWLGCDSAQPTESPEDSAHLEQKPAAQQPQPVTSAETMGGTNGDEESAGGLQLCCAGCESAPDGRSHCTDCDEAVGIAQCTNHNKTHKDCHSYVCRKGESGVDCECGVPEASSGTDLCCSECTDDPVRGRTCTGCEEAGPAASISDCTSRNRTHANCSGHECTKGSNGFDCACSAPQSA